MPGRGGSPGRGGAGLSPADPGRRDDGAAARPRPGVHRRDLRRPGPREAAPVGVERRAATRRLASHAWSSVRGVVDLASPRAGDGEAEAADGRVVADRPEAVHLIRRDVDKVSLADLAALLAD